MSHLLAVWLPIIAAQSPGVGLAWGVDALSWKWRRNETIVFALNLFNAVTLFPFLLLRLSFYTHDGSLSSTSVVGAWSFLLFWLLCIAWVQQRQMENSLRAAFFGALMQLLCFIWALYGGFLILAFFPSPVSVLSSASHFPLWIVLVSLVSATLTYALLSLFRPTITAMKNALREILRKRPLR